MMIYIAFALIIVAAIAIHYLTSQHSGGGGFSANGLEKGNFGKELKSLRIPTLSMYAKDLSFAASKGALDPVVGRDEEIRRVIQILSRRTKNNPILIGKAGVGKTAVVEGLAQTLLSNIWHSNLKNKRVLSLDLSGLLAGTKYRGEFEKRLQAVTREIISAQRSIILFIDEIHTLAEAGEATGGIGAADILKPALARGDLQIIGATTPEEYETIIKRDTTLARRFQPVEIMEPSRLSTIAILEALKPRYSSYHGVKISREAILAAVDLTNKYIKGRHQPDKAIDVMDEASSLVKLESIIAPSQKKDSPVVRASHVAKVVRDWNKIGMKH